MFFDHVLRSGYDLPKETEVVVADDIVEYYYAGTTQEHFRLSDFPNLMPPFRRLFVETRHPSGIRSEVHGSVPWNGPHAWGVSLERFAAEPEGWNVFFALLWQMDRKGPIHLVLSGSVPLTNDGRLRSNDIPVNLHIGTSQGILSDFVDSFAEFLKPLFLAISFMHCKNVVTTSVSPPSAVSRAWKRRHGVPLVSYRVLDIKPFRVAARSAGHGVAEPSVKKALHICRGHFKTYTPDRPLFGRVAGTFWVEQHMRGAATSGEIKKTYRVATPARGAND